MLRDNVNNSQSKIAIAPQSSGGDTPLVSLICDTQDFDSVKAVISIGSIGDANATFTVLVEEGNTGTVGSTTLSDATAVADADLIGTENGASFQFDDDNETRVIGYKGSKRYIRLTITPSGNSSSPSAAFLGATWEKGNARTVPQSSQAA